MAQYDVGKVVRDYSVEFLHTEPNLATPTNLDLLLGTLEQLTAELELADQERRAMPGTEFTFECIDPDTGEAFDQLCLDLMRWRVRLDDYRAWVDDVPGYERDSHEVVLWEVTAPLFLGYHGGRTGTEIELIEGGYPPGFNVFTQHAPDLATPFSIANELEVYEEFEQEQWDRLLEDIVEETKKVAETGKDIGTAVIVGASILGGLYVLGRVLPQRS